MCIAVAATNLQSTFQICRARWLSLTLDSGYAAQSAALGRMKPGLIGPVTGQRQTLMAPHRREVLLDNGRVFVQKPGLMTDDELANVFDSRLR
jgi:hypothetical protein